MKLIVLIARGGFVVMLKVTWPFLTRVNHRVNCYELAEKLKCQGGMKL